MEKKVTDKKIVISQLAKIHSLEKRSSIKKSYAFSSKENIVGEKIYVKPNTYHEDLTKIVNSEKNHILLFDNSVISMHYCFDTKGRMTYHSLYYIPDIYDEEFFWRTNQSDNEMAYYDYVNAVIAKYLRIDFDVEGYNEYNHSLVHMHMGLKSTDFRFPVYSYLYPNEFVYLILKYIYTDDDSKLKSIASFAKNNRIIKLTKTEKEKFFA